MSTSGNGPTVITIAHSSYEPPAETTEDTSEEPQEKVAKRSIRDLLTKKPKAEKADASSDAPKLSFQEKLDVWVRESKPVDDPLQLTLWWIYVILHLHLTRMHPPKEVSYFRVQKVLRAARDAVNYVREETAAIVGVIAIKGGVGKTTISTWFGVAMAWATKLSVAIVDTDRGGGLVAKRFWLSKKKTSTGETKRALSVYDLGKRVEAGEVFTPQKLIEETISDSETGVMIFRAPPSRGMSVARTDKLLRHVREQFAGGMVVDTTPGSRVPMTNAVALTSDVKIIVALGVSSESLMLLRVALNSEAYKLRGSLDSVLVVFIGLPARKCNKRTTYELADRLNLRPTKESIANGASESEEDDQEVELEPVPDNERLPASQILFLPQDRYMDTRKVKELGPVRFSAAKPRTQLALIQLVKAKDDLVLRMKEKAAMPTPSPEPEEEPRRHNLTTLQQRASA